MKNDQKSFRKFKKGPILLSLLFLALSCLGLFYVFQKINQNKTAATEALRIWAEEDARRNELKSLDAMLENIKKETAALDEHFAQKSNVVPFLDSLEELGTEAGASSEVLSVETTPNGSDLLISLEAEGSFRAVYKFLQLLENSPYELEFLALDMGRSSGGDSTAEWEGFFKIKLLTFTP